MIIGLLAYSNSIVSRLRDDNREIVKVYAEIIAKTVNEDSEANLNFVFNEIIKKVQFPIINSDVDSNLTSKNIQGDLSQGRLKRIQASMDIQNEPIPLSF
ncbi:uncharacterized protein METZ01_LOCUS433506, partial [marine metagenome]